MGARLTLALLLALSQPVQAATTPPLLGSPVVLLVENALTERLGEQLPEGASLHLSLPRNAPEMALRITQIEHDVQQGIYAAVVETPEGRLETLRGRFEARVPVPVPNRAIMPGEIASVDDFTLTPLPLNAIGRLAISDMNQIEGREVRRLLPAGRPVQSQSLQTPRAIERGQKLTIHYNQGPLELTARGRALEDAALGEHVRVQNLTSNKTVTGIAMGDGRVEIPR